MKLIIFALSMTFWGIVIAALLMGLVGTSVTPPPQVTDRGALHYFGNEAEGDLNNDGVADAAFLVVSSSEGSGTFYYVAAALGTSQGYQTTNTVFLGDRIAPQTTQIVGGTVVVNFADRKVNEPMTAKPSVGVTKRFRVASPATLVALP
jgi:hypothetical protein